MRVLPHAILSKEFFLLPLHRFLARLYTIWQKQNHTK